MSIAEREAASVARAAAQFAALAESLQTPATMAGAPIPTGHAAALQNYVNVRQSAPIPTALQTSLLPDVPDKDGQLSLL